MVKGSILRIRDRRKIRMVKGSILRIWDNGKDISGYHGVMSKRDCSCNFS